jgi:hypothetical protein
VAELTHESLRASLGIAVLQVVFSSLLIRLAPRDEGRGDDQERVGEGDDQERVGEGDDRALGPTPCRAAPVAGRQRGMFGMRGRLSGLPWRVRPLRCWPARSLVPGASPAQAAQAAAQGKRRLSVPISATRIWAVVVDTPGIVSSKATATAASAAAAQARWICASKRAIVSSRVSIWVSHSASTKLWCGRSCPCSACASCARFRA